MENLNGIPFTSFLIGIIFLALLWATTNYYRPALTWLRKNAPHVFPYWNRWLLIAALILFVLLNPLLHSVIGIISAVLVYLMILRKESHIVLGAPRGVKKDTSTTYKLRCAYAADKGASESYDILKSKIFAFLHVKDGSTPNIQHRNDRYEVEVTLTHEKYLDSLITYLNNSQIKTTII